MPMEEKTLTHVQKHVSRVNQLDALALDSEIFNILKENLTSTLQVLNPRWVLSFQPEINSLLKYLLWKFTVFETGASIGQKMLDMEYIDSNTQNLLNNRKKILLVIMDICGSWLNQRITSNFVLSHLSLKWQNQVLTFTRIIAIISKISSVLNFLIFLRNGKYQVVIERLLKIRSGNSKPQKLRQVEYEYMNRELLWHGFAEFVSFALPLLNVYRVKNSVSRLLWPNTQIITHSSSRTQKDFESCALCNETPIRPCEMGCSHVFCYYCVASHLKADAMFNCPKCFKQALDGLNCLRQISIT